ncbi:hypothetical protein E4T48_08123 [Aureobasidium sp. EXF-10727]|nr:hypothetical protein E4T48_08123 [Aureobasidium sp. EXF-10727]
MPTSITISVTGTAILPLTAEHALLFIQIRCSNPSRTSLATETQLCCRRLEDFLRTSSCPNEGQKPLVAHWSMNAIKTFPQPSPDPHHLATSKPAQKVLETIVGYNVRVKDLQKLGSFAAQVGCLQNTEVLGLRWGVSDSTRTTHASRLRRLAGEDALERAKDYARALRLSAVWPVEVRETGWGEDDVDGVVRGQEKAVDMDVRRLVVDSDMAFADLVFEAEELTMGARVECKFEAE